MLTAAGQSLRAHAGRVALAMGDGGRFQNAVANRTAPARNSGSEAPKPKPAPKPAAQAPEPAARPDTLADRLRALTDRFR